MNSWMLRHFSLNTGGGVAYRLMAAVCMIGLLSISSCIPDASHDNPLDPLSPSFSANASLKGTVVVRNQIQVPVKGALVVVLPVNRGTQSDSTGAFSFSDLSPGSYTLIATKTGFIAETLAVVLKQDEPGTATFTLNGLPTITGMKIQTRKIDQWWPNPVYYAHVQAVVDDPNGAIELDSVWFMAENQLFPMQYSLSDKKFEADIYSYQLSSNTLEWLVGKPLYIVGRDASKAIGTSSVFAVSRLMEIQATQLLPAIGDTVSSQPAFQWTPPDVTFNLTYTINVVRNDAGTQTVVWSQESIDSFLRTITYPGTLQAGSYFWTIAIVDEYGNWSRSKESPFIVQ